MSHDIGESPQCVMLYIQLHVPMIGGQLNSKTSLYQFRDSHHKESHNCLIFKLKFSTWKTVFILKQGPGFSTRHFDWCPNNCAMHYENRKSLKTNISAHGLAQDCGDSSALAMELPQSCTKPLSITEVLHPQHRDFCLEDMCHVFLMPCRCRGVLCYS